DVDVESNYLTIAMLQDSVWGSQNEGESNPEQYVDGNYCHMHTLRDIITDTWGDEISPTGNGTLITKTYNYKIPEIIGDPNGVEVVLEHLDFIAFVTKDKTSEKSRPILNACRLPLLLGSQENVFPYFEVVTEKHNSFCDNNKTFTINMMNRGLDEITSLKMLMEADNGDTFEYEWNGNLASYDVGEIKFDMDVPIGTHDIDFKIVEANGQPFSYSKTIRTNCEEWTTIFVEHENDEIVLELMQDKFGNETTWKIITDDDTVLASGGPYEYYFGQTTATEFHEIPLQLPLNQCMKFVLSDQLGNGICCDYGDGYYRIIDGHGNVVVDGSGDFGYEASFNFTLEVGVGAEETAINDIKIYPNPAKDVVKVSTVNSQRSTVKVYNYLGILVEEIELDAEEIELDVSGYNPGIYFFNINGKTVKVTIEN
ncbi:MAG: Omp28-related outer membrane protein, partial [Bacteroidales bacterium]|nr:Omp28-related outer membrane protein [Bacteroidales bacterium]